MCRNHSNRHLPHGTTRRDVLRFTLGSVGLAALGPLWLERLPTATGAPQNLTRLIVINLVGGNDGLNTVIPRALQGQYDALRPNIKIVSGAQLLLDQGPNATLNYGLHPALDQIRTLWNEGSAAIVNRSGYPDANLSHFTSSDIYAQAVREDFGSLGIPPSGWIARYADLFANTPMGAVSVGMGRPLEFVGGSSNPFLAGSLAAFNYQNDAGQPPTFPGYPADAQHRLQVVQDVLAGFGGVGASAQAKTALLLGQQLAGQIQAAVAGYTTAVTWPASSLGNYLRDVSTLIQGGFETRVFYTGFGGFDSHAGEGNGTGTHATLLGRLDDAVAAFAQDMKNRGQWNNTRIVVFSEFGRRNYENASFGTDHAEGSVVFELGGGLNGGMKGPDLVAGDLAGDAVEYAVDFRDIYRDVIVNHLGAPTADGVFPETQPINTALGIA
jgi:uncharacterized protein (DUF1501 family)